MKKAVGRYFYKKYGISDAEYKLQRERGLRYCGIHGWMDESEFHNRKNCRRCRSKYAKEWKEKNPLRVRAHLDKSREKDRIRAYNRYHSFTPEQKRAEARKSKLRTYGVTPAWYHEQLERQNGVCAICEKHLPSGKYGKYMHVDHNHTTGKARGVICNGCNTGIAWLEKTEWRQRAEAYLKSYEPTELGSALT